MLDTTVDILAQRYRAAFDKMEGGRAQWIEGTLELAQVAAEARDLMPDHREYNRWLQRHGLLSLHPNDRAALIGFAKDPETGRKLLEQSSSKSWRGIWEKRPRRTLTTIGKGTPSTVSAPNKRNRTGSSHRARIPDVMRDDYVPGEIAKRAAARPAEPKRRRRASRPTDPTPPRERPVPILKGLTREQVDPDFKGDAHEFTRVYGIVNLHTKQQIEHRKQQEALMAWLGLLSEHEQTARALLTANAVDPAVLREWMARPAKAEKLQRWRANIQLACESLRKLVEPDVP